MSNLMKKEIGGSERIAKSACVDRQNNNFAKDCSSDDETILNNPLLKIEVMFDRKIRNLEKRKQKLLQYGIQEKNGEQLTYDQKAAYSKLGEVFRQVEFCTEMRKAIEENAKRYQQALKRAHESDRKKREESERKKLAALMRYQELSNVLGNRLVRNAFERGSHSAINLSEKELKMVGDLYTMLNPSLDGVCDVESWLKKTDECASLAACILDASKETTVVQQHSGDEIKALLDKISGIEFAQLCKLLDEGKQKEEVKSVVEASVQTQADSVAPITLNNGVDECSVAEEVKSVVEASVQTQADSVAPITLNNGVDECSVAVAASPNESAELRAKPNVVENHDDVTSKAESKDTIKEVAAIAKTTNSPRTQQKLNSKSVIRGEYDRNNTHSGERLSVRFDNSATYRKRDRRHPWNENRFGTSYGYNSMQYRNFGANRQSSYSNYNSNEYVDDRIYKDDNYYGYYPTLPPFSASGPIANEPYYCFAYLSNFMNSQHFTDRYTAENSMPNQEDHVFMQDNLCTCPPYGFEISQPLTRMVNPVGMANMDMAYSSEPFTY
ncbi:Caprin-1 [Toxocara canis]|uniref:Caprin-1 n=1 Tax=Toxocara canis TaxID=6265 RepID=A0A0B2UMS7_TOXCA|nr:Caprin-1 [Toxocara canis]